MLGNVNDISYKVNGKDYLHVAVCTRNEHKVNEVL